MFVIVAGAVGVEVSAFGWFSDRVGLRKPLYIAGAAVAMVGWVGIIYAKNIPVYGLLGLLILTGFSSGAMILSFAFAKESVPPRLSGTISGIINTGVMFGPMLLQPAVGWVLDVKWEGAVSGSVRVYSLEAFQSGFTLMLVWAVLSFVLLFFTRETHCRQRT